MARKTSVETKTVETKTAAKPAAKTAAAKTAKAAETVEKKPAAKKTTAKKPAAKKPVVTTEAFVQYLGKEFSTTEIIESVKKIWVEELGKSMDDLKDIRVYVKPEDNGAHYVINNEITGFIAL